MIARIAIALSVLLPFLAAPSGGDRAREALEHLRLREADLPAGWKLLPADRVLPGEADFRAAIERRMLVPAAPGGPPPRAIIETSHVEDTDGPFPVLHVSFAEQADANAAARRLKADPTAEPRIAFIQALSVIHVAPARSGGFARLLQPVVAGRVGQDAWGKASTAWREGRLEEARAILYDYTWAHPKAEPLAVFAISLSGLRRDEDAIKAAAGVRRAGDYGALAPDLHADLLHGEGVSLIRLGRREEGRKRFEEAVALGTAPSAEKRARAHYDLARLHAEDGRKSDALRELREALAIERGAGGTALRDGAKTDPIFDAIRSDPEFRRIVEGR